MKSSEKMFALIVKFNAVDDFRGSEVGLSCKIYYDFEGLYNACEILVDVKEWQIYI